ncbi:galactose oxidase early set domain-containing protein [Rhodoferax sp.]|uniref:galactose oxidase early set domain-containing protein n=1 Tax=Rhodoferax sp. TaxID=50421 RepID=UPI0025FFDD90|nr:galactose oxidase early set domain-containing protein [Rhodoferax sp.]
MAYGRWYGSQVTLASGRLLVAGGIDEADGFSVTPEIRNSDGSWSKVSNVEIGDNLYYPRLLVGPQLAPNVDSVYILAGVGQRSVYRLDLPVAGTEGTLVNTGIRLSAAAGWERPLAMVNATQVLVQLDSGATELLTLPTTATGKPSVKSAGRMIQARPWSNFTVLPTGDVLANGGSGAVEVEKLVKVAYHAELWSAKTQTWTTMASELRPRLYHSTAVLLADGRVQSMGGGAPGPVLGTNAQTYSPSYLFNTDGRASVRPTLNAIPAVLNLGSTTRTITVGDASTIKRVTLVKTSSVTHSYNTEQRFLELGFTQVNATTLRLTAPANAATATPGYYWLSVINAAEVPSISKLVAVLQ